MLYGFSCKDVTERASDFVTHRMSRLDRVKYRVHLLICENCRRFVAQFRATVSSLRLRPQNITAEPAAVDDQVAFLLNAQRALRNQKNESDPP